jgi:TRAP-type C4-dicarboxylate transport system permease small subunit
MRRMAKISKLLVELMAGACLSSLILLTLLAVFARYILNSPLAWAEEVQMFLMIWTVMLGAIIAAWHKSALRIDIIFSLTTPRFHLFLERLAWAVTVAIIIPIGYYGWRLSVVGKNKMTNLLFISYSYINIAILVGAIGIALISLIYFCRPKRKREAVGGEEEEE